MNDRIPASLARYQQALEDAIRRDVASAAAGRRRRRTGMRLLIAGGAAAVGLGAISLLLAGVPSTVAPAGAAIIRQAEAALSASPGTMLHVASTGTQANGDGTTVSWRQESFSEPHAPYDRRLVNEQLPGTPPGVEQAAVDGTSQIYDPTRDRIYIAPQPSHSPAPSSNVNLPKYGFSLGPAPGTYRVRVPFAILKASQSKGKPATHVKTIYRTLIITAVQADALRNGTDTIRATFHGDTLRVTELRVARAPRASSAGEDHGVDPFSAGFRGQILSLLRSGRARVRGHTTIDGRDTIEIQSADAM